MNELIEIEKFVYDYIENTKLIDFKLESLHQYTDEESRLLFVRFRLVNAYGEKHIRPLSKDENGKWCQLKEPKFTNGKPLYNLALLSKYKDETVFIVEGEKCADALSNLGLITTTSGSATSAKDANWNILSGRKVTIWPDNDDSGNKYANEVAGLLSKLNADVKFIDIKNLVLPAKGDCVDWLESFAANFKRNANKNEVQSIRVISKSIEVDRTTTTNMPEPLPTLPPVLPFDYLYLPLILRDYVRDISERMQCPADFSAVATLVMLGTIVGRKIGVRPMRNDNWTVIPNLWGAVVGSSGVMKSPTLSATLAPLKRMVKKAYDEYDSNISNIKVQNEVSKLQNSILKDEAKKALKKDRNADISKLISSDEKSDVPVVKRYITNNASYEALGEILIENPNGILVEADELIGVLKQLDSSGQEAARAFYLTAADGDKGYTFDRIIRGKGLHIDGVCLSVLGGIQPGVMANYIRLANNGGAGADGLMQRFSLLVYPDISKNWDEIDRKPNLDILNSIVELTEKLDTLDLEALGAETDETSNIPFLRFDNNAQLLFSDWRAPYEKLIRTGEDHPSIVSHLSKYRKLIPTIALLYHLCEGQPGPIQEMSLMRALAFSEYLESHARRVYSYAISPELDAAKSLLKKLNLNKLEHSFKARDVSQKGWAGLETPDKATAAIDLLVEYGHLSSEQLITGGRPTTLYHWIKDCK